MVIIVFINCKIHRRSFKHLLVLQQSFLDMLVFCFYLCAFYYPVPKRNIVYCKFGTLFFFCLSASTLNLVFISVERYIAVVHPLKYWIRGKQMRSNLPQLCIPLVAAFLITLQYAFILEEDPAVPGACTFCYKNEGFQMLSGTILLLANWVIPVCTMTFCYYHVYITLKKQAKIRAELTMQAHTKGAGDESAVEINISPSQANRKDKAHDAQRNFITTMSINTLVYFTCVTPWILFYVIYTICESFDGINHVFRNYVFLILYINNAANPIVYAIIFKDFKEGFSKTLS
ncbi:alpha-1A adrenergic receptor-like [Anneissia japonica]|uniref:alpha-1A adrenergic receptor-like n=1 Tax=Anneissia japonica TaxID=1529436 RepID=UPI0014256939|nr:alpha-1A adrenergic receptor-like [Anneissia japonica]